MPDRRATFQRARRPGEIEARQTAILNTARGMLLDRPVADISLRELATEVGLAKSNVLGYFESREAIFLELLNTEWQSWLDDLDTLLPKPLPGDGRPRTKESALATIVADSLVARPMLCELLSAMAAVLERNISLEFAREFKRKASANNDRLAAAVAARLPHLPQATPHEFAGAVIVLVAGMWPFANPTDTVATVSREMGFPPPKEKFAVGLRGGLAAHLIGMAVRDAATEGD
ncbi:TetR/AcrR family transcriptional regulator [Streptomyces inusitatus]|uniref:TetR/AcrR family transcriptional regulator n=1 Tax=Streptomyces inusitatus TaxID=68221 RepID=UPI001E3B7CB7|nr:TetR family transcriptional regulator [Streptomyces inusitatus]